MKEGKLLLKYSSAIPFLEGCALSFWKDTRTVLPNRGSEHSATYSDLTFAASGSRLNWRVFRYNYRTRLITVITVVLYQNTLLVKDGI